MNSPLEAWNHLFNKPQSPLIKIQGETNINIFVKQDYKNHKWVQGNKLRKLKYNILQAIEEGYDSVLTFGGAYSNHIIATAKAAQECGLKSIAVIRGEELENNKEKWSQTLIDADKYGMQLNFISRSEYRRKHQSIEIKKWLKQRSSSIYVIPEGGSNRLAVKGVTEIITELESQIAPPDYIFSACGTGGTLAGLIEGVYSLGWSTKVCGVAVLKASKSIRQKVVELTDNSDKVKWDIFENYHFGGYAKGSLELQRFAQRFSNKYSIPLDTVYTSKLFFAVFDLLSKGEISSDSNVLILHTGGLQGGQF